MVFSKILILTTTVICQEIAPLPKIIADPLAEIFHKIRHCKVQSGRPSGVLPRECMPGNEITQNTNPAVLKRDIRGILRRKVEMEICKTEPCQRKSLFIPTKVMILSKKIFTMIYECFIDKFT